MTIVGGVMEESIYALYKNKLIKGSSEKVGEGKTTYLLSASFRIYKNISYITLHYTLTLTTLPA